MVATTERRAHPHSPVIHLPQPNPRAALLVTDIQNDFCPGGALAVPGGDAIIPQVNEYLSLFQSQGATIVATRDWHPASHCSFRDQGGRWPVHCVQGSWGAQFHPALRLPSDCLIISKATDPTCEAYSAFEGTTLADRLHQAETDTIFITGLATDYCVKSTVLDARRLGFRVVLLHDAIRGIDEAAGDSERAVRAMQEAGAMVGRALDFNLPGGR